MQKFLLYGSYSPQGYRGLLAEGGSGRTDAVRQALNSLGGDMEAMYFSFGEHDFYTIVNLPDNINAAAFTMTANVSGAFSIKTAALLTPEEIDSAIKLGVSFRPPGQ